jgi:hypothetical protein
MRHPRGDFAAGVCCVDPTESVSNRWRGLATGLEAGCELGEGQAYTVDEGLIGDDVVVAAAQVLHKRVSGGDRTAARCHQLRPAR